MTLQKRAVRNVAKVKYRESMVNTLEELKLLIVKKITEI